MKQNKQWYLGFFACFAFFAVPGLLQGDWGQAVWLVWLVWIVYFFPRSGNGQSEADSSTPDTSPDEQSS